MTIAAVARMEEQERREDRAAHFRRIEDEYEGAFADRIAHAYYERDGNGRFVKPLPQHGIPFPVRKRDNVSMSAKPTMKLSIGALTEVMLRRARERTRTQNCAELDRRRSSKGFLVYSDFTECPPSL